MNDELQLTSDESPRPWFVRRPIDNAPNLVNIEGLAGGCIIARNIKDEDAALIVRAVNGREDLLKAREMLQAECRGLAAEADRMAEFVRKLCDMVADHPVWRPSEAERWLIAEARKAIGEDAE